jgi:hypothetical protein
LIASLFIEKELQGEGHRADVYKPHCWFGYVDDSFMIWPYDSNRLKDLLEYLNSIHHNIQFTMETETDINNYRDRMVLWVT